MRQKMISILAITILIFGLSSCTLGDNTIDPADLATPDIVQNGTWRVSLYNDCGDDETYHFAGYGFIFDTTGLVTAIKDSSTLNGIWSTGTDDGQNIFYLHFETTCLFNELNDDWHIVEKTSAKISLEDVSNRNDDNDFLTFEKNK